MSKLPKIDRQREHQANERTFLAWLRTSIALIGFGFAIARFGFLIRQLEQTIAPQSSVLNRLASSETIGVAFAIAGVVIIALALWNYHQHFRQIERGDYQPNPWMVTLTAGIAMVLGGLSLILMLGTRSAALEEDFSRTRPAPSKTQAFHRRTRY
jgi:putative membrane protein